jgi:putative sigma-54 modulation protein
MRIDVIGRNIEITEPIKTYAETKAGKLGNHHEGLQLVTFRVIRPNAHHTTDIEVELVLDVEHHDDFVSHATGRDAYAAIDLVVEKGDRQLREHRERMKNHR